MAKIKEVKEEVKEVKALIAPLDLDLGREDLNKLVGKVNELITRLNQ